jgi:hypothetical protein
MLSLINDSGIQLLAAEPRRRIRISPFFIARPALTH